MAERNECAMRTTCPIGQVCTPTHLSTKVDSKLLENVEGACELVSQYPSAGASEPPVLNEHKHTKCEFSTAACARQAKAYLHWNCDHKSSARKHIKVSITTLLDKL